MITNLWEKFQMMFGIDQATLIATISLIGVEFAEWIEGRFIVKDSLIIIMSIIIIILILRLQVNNK